MISDETLKRLRAVTAHMAQSHQIELLEDLHSETPSAYVSTLLLLLPNLKHLYIQGYKQPKDWMSPKFVILMKHFAFLAGLFPRRLELGKGPWDRHYYQEVLQTLGSRIHTLKLAGNFFRRSDRYGHIGKLYLMPGIRALAPLTHLRRLVVHADTIRPDFDISQWPASLRELAHVGAKPLYPKEFVRRLSQLASGARRPAALLDVDLFLRGYDNYRAVKSVIDVARANGLRLQFTGEYEWWRFYS